MGSLLHVPGETRLFAGLSNGDLVSVDLASGEIGSRAKLGGAVASYVCSNSQLGRVCVFFPKRYQSGCIKVNRDDMCRCVTVCRCGSE